jgi:uncharacterized protein (UPF0218 family)
MATLALPRHMRAELKVPLGRLLKGEPSETVSRLRKILKESNPPMFAVVGDFSAKNILKAGIEPDLVVVDHRVMRVEVGPLDHGDRRVLWTRNRAGTIDSEAWSALEEAVTLNSRVAVIVEGEEDLLVLPLISLMPLESLIAYGQPFEGIVLVEASEERKGWAEGFMSRMEECEAEDRAHGHEG